MSKNIESELISASYVSPTNIRRSAQYARGARRQAINLIDLERMLHNELESPDINFSDKTARTVYGLKWDNHVGLLGLLRHVLALDAIPDYASVVGAFVRRPHHVTQLYTAIRFDFFGPLRTYSSQAAACRRPTCTTPPADRVRSQRRRSALLPRSGQRPRPPH